MRRPIGRAAVHGSRVYAATMAYDDARAPHRRRAEPRQPQAGTRRDRPVRRAGDDREGPAPRRRVPPDRRQRAPPRRHLGRRSCATSARTCPPPDGPRMRVRFIILAARLLGTGAVADLVKALEGDEEDGLRRPGHLARGRRDRRRRARARGDLGPAQGRRAGAPAVARATASRDGVAIARPARSAAEVGSRESWHRAGGRSGTLRAVIFGVSDGLVSNLSLVMGVAGASVGQPELHPARRHRRAARRRVQHGRRRVHLDAEPARAVRAPDRPRTGRDGGDARGGGGRAGRLVPGQGLHRRRGGHASPIGSSRTPRPRSTCSSARSSGSIPTSSARRGAPQPARSSRSRSAPSIPVIPYLFGGGTAVLLVSLGLSLVALFAVGAAVSLLTGRGLIFSGFRQLGIGLAAALVTYAIGSIIGVVAAEADAEDVGCTACATRASTRRSWSNGPGDRYAAHEHGYDKVIVVERGSIRFGLPADGEAIDLGGGRPPGAAGRHRAMTPSSAAMA